MSELEAWSKGVYLFLMMNTLLLAAIFVMLVVIVIAGTRK